MTCFNCKNPPFAHQLSYLERFACEPACALLADMGTGKSYMLLNNYRFLLEQGKVRHMMVFAPNGVQWNWVQNEVPKHLQGANGVNVFCAGFSGAMRKAQKDAWELAYTYITSPHGLPCILCINWDAISHAHGFKVVEQYAKAMAKHGGMFLALDESDYIKNPSATRAKNAHKLAQYALYRRIATGTPITNSPFDAWSQFQFLSPNILRCPSFHAFKARHCDFYSASSPLVQSIARKGGRGVPQIPIKDSTGRPRYKNLEDLTRRLTPYSFRVTKSECLDLPDKLYRTELLELTSLQRAAYNLVAKNNMMLIQNEAVPLINKLSALGALCQICGNHYPPKALAQTDNVLPSGEVDPTNNPKLIRTLELVEQALQQGEQVIIWARYRAEINDLLIALSACKINAVSYYGDMAPVERQSALEAFHLGKAPVFVATPQAGGTGLTLTEASTVIYYSNSFSLHDRLQSEDRAHRIGQKRSVLYIDLAMMGTVEQSILRALQSKQDIAQTIIGDLQAGRLA